MTVGLVVAGLLVLFGASQGSGSSTAPPVQASDLMLDAEYCAKGADTIEGVAQAISEAGGPRGDGVIAAIEQAEIRMARRVAAPSDDLVAAFSNLDAGLGVLRRAILADEGIAAATDALIMLIDALDVECQAVLAPPSGST